MARRTEPALHLRACPHPPTRRATAVELVECIAGLVACIAIGIAAVVFMAIDVEFPDTFYGSVLGIPTWQIANYVMNTVFTIVGVLISINMVALYSATQRTLLARSNGVRGGEIPAEALTKPGIVTAYTLFGSNYSLVFVSLVVAIVPVLSAITAFLIDFKLTTRELKICATGQNITTLFDTIDDMFAWYQMNGTAFGEWAALSALVLSLSTAQLPDTASPFFPHDFLSNSMNAVSLDGFDDSIQFAGTTFLGNSTYGVAGASRAMWQEGMSLPPGVLDPVVTKLFPATTLRIERAVPGQTSAFTCDSLALESTSAALAAAGNASIASPAVMRYTVLTDGPCFTRNSTFLVGAFDDPRSLAQFDIQACSGGDMLQLQLVVLSPDGGESTSSYAAEAYNCSSLIMEGMTRALQSSPYSLQVLPPTQGLHTIASDALQRYAAHLNVYFGLGTYPISLDPIAVPAGLPRSQGAWASPLQHNWVRTPAGPVQWPGDPPPHRRTPVPNATSYWPAADFLPAYGDALVAGLGTYLASLFAAARPLAGLASDAPCDAFDVLVKQVLRLGAPAKAGASLLLVVFVVAAAHGVLLRLYSCRLPAIQIDDVVDMLRKVEVSSRDVVTVAELYATDGAETVGLLAVPSLKVGGDLDTTTGEKGWDI